MRPRVAVIGGGIAGLAAAHRLREIDPAINVLLFEAGPRLGGVLQTTQQDGFLLEDAADNFYSAPPAAAKLCARLGLAESLVQPNHTRHQALVVRRGKLLPIPAGFQLMAPSRLSPLVSTPILSAGGKLRAAMEYFVPQRTSDVDESLASFARRRFGREVYERLVQPLAGGIYAADLERLSLDATMPRFRQMEREHGSLIRALLHSRNQPRPAGGEAKNAQFFALRGGMAELVKALADRLPAGSVRCDAPVERLFALDHGRWLLAIGGSQSLSLPVDGVIVAAPAHHAAGIVEGVDEVVASHLRSIDYASCAVISLAYERAQIGHPLNAFGFVVPLVEERMILSCSFSSVKYSGRAPQGTVFVRVFIGGACQAGLMLLPRHELLELAEREIAELLQIRGAPILRHAARRALPQYHVGHRANVAGIETRLQRFPTLTLAGSALYGVGIPHCIQSGEAAAERMAPQLHYAFTTVRQAANV